jgi:hypothetical protein
MREEIEWNVVCDRRSGRGPRRGTGARENESDSGMKRNPIFSTRLESPRRERAADAAAGGTEHVT